MKTKITTIILLCLTICLSDLNGQSYNNAIGLRMGTDWGMTFKQRVAKRITVEGILQSSLQREEAILTLMLEKHFNFITRRLNIYWGGGIHKGWIDDVYQESSVQDPFGMSFIIGGEFTLGKINLSYDLKPAFNVVGGEKRMYTQSGISVRYVLTKRKKYNWEKKNKGKGKKKKNSQMNKNSSWKFWKK